MPLTFWVAPSTHLPTCSPVACRLWGLARGRLAVPLRARWEYLAEHFWAQYKSMAERLVIAARLAGL